MTLSCFGGVLKYLTHVKTTVCIVLFVQRFIQFICLVIDNVVVNKAKRN